MAKQNSNVQVLSSENLTDEEKNLLDFLEEDNLIVDKSVDTDRENYLDSDDGPADDIVDDLVNSRNSNSDDNQNSDNPENTTQANSDNKSAQQDGDLSDEDLLKLAAPDDPAASQQAIQEPIEFNSPVEISTYLGFNFDGKRPEEITLKAVKEEVETLRKLATESDLKEVKNIKEFLLNNPGASEIDYFQQFVSPLEPLTLLGDKELLMFKFINVDKISKEDAEKKLDSLVYDNKVEEEAKNIRSFVNERNTQFYKDRDAKIEEQKKAAEATKIAKRKELMSEIIKAKPNFMEGQIVLTNKDIEALYTEITSGNVHKQLKEHKVIAEVAWFLKNKKTLIQVLKEDGESSAKLDLLNRLANSKRQEPRRGNPPSADDAMKINPDDWGD